MPSPGGEHRYAVGMFRDGAASMRLLDVHRDHRTGVRIRLAGQDYSELLLSGVTASEARELVQQRPADRNRLRGSPGPALIGCTMDDATGGRIDLVLVTAPEAARIAEGTPGERDRWAEGFPRGEDRAPCRRFAAVADDVGAFGVYLIVPRTHGLAIGTAGFYGPPDASGEVTVGYGMVEPEWGNGYGTEALTGLVGICRSHGGVATIAADTDVTNIASQRVLEKNGFTRLRTVDELCYYALSLRP